MGRDEITVSELIEKLKQLPHDMPVMTICSESGYYHSLPDRKIEVTPMFRDLNLYRHGGDHVSEEDSEWFVDHSNKMNYEQIDINDYSVEKVLVIG